MKSIVFKYIFFLILFCNSINTQVINSKPFNINEYPEKYFDYADTTIYFNKLDILIKRIVIKNEYKFNNEISTDIYAPCYWIDIKKNNIAINTLSFYNIEALGGYGGIFYPKIQISDDFLILSKRGDYDGRTIIIKQDGQYLNLPGGEFIYTENKKYIINFHELDGWSSVNIFDIIKEKLIYNSYDLNIFIGYPDCYKKENVVYINTNPNLEEYLKNKFITIDIETAKTEIIDFDKKILNYTKLETVQLSNVF